MNSCPNCGSNVNQGEAFCKVCGSKMQSSQNIINNTQPSQPVNEQINNQNISSNQQYINPAVQCFQQSQNNGNNMQQNSYIDNDDLIDSYIGANAKKIKKGGTSWSCLFIGILYVLYRKMWLLGFIWWVISIISNIFLPSVASYISLFLDVAISMEFKKWYLKHAEEQVDKIKTENPGKSKEELMKICKKKGGVTLIPDIIYIIYVILLIIVGMGVLVEDEENQTDYSNTSSNEAIAMENLDITIPDIFVLNNNLSTDYYKSYSTTNADCSLTVSTDQADYYDNDVKKYLEADIYYSPDNTYSGISEKNLNGNNWYHATVTTSYGKYYYYSALYNETIYEIKFSIYDDNQICSKAHDTVINSLNFK